MVLLDSMSICSSIVNLFSSALINQSQWYHSGIGGADTPSNKPNGINSIIKYLVVYFEIVSIINSILSFCVNSKWCVIASATTNSELISDGKEGVIVDSGGHWNYGYDYIAGQIQAVIDSDSDGYILWNASNRYYQTLRWIREFDNLD